MALVAKTNKVRTDEERIILAKNLIIFTAVYEEVRKYLAEEKNSDKTKKYPNIDRVDIIYELLATRRENISKLCHRNTLGSVTAKMVSSAKIKGRGKIDIVLSDKKVWFNNDEIANYDWDTSFNMNFDTYDIVIGIRKCIRDTVVRVLKINDESDTRNKMIVWLKETIIEQYRNENFSKKEKKRIDTISELIDGVGIVLLEQSEENSLIELRGNAEKLIKRIDAVLTYREFYKM